jgi:dihydrofolate reductase
MRKLRVFESISIDGYFTDGSGSMSWAHAGPPDDEFNAWVAANASSGAELIFGRKTYEEMAAFWPTPMAMQQMPTVAKAMNAAKKHVVSRSITPTWNNTQLMHGDLVAAVRALKTASGPAMTVLGSGNVAAQLGAAGLVDEYQFVIVPIALGSGRTVFSSRHDLKLVEQRGFASGRVVVTYAA